MLVLGDTLKGPTANQAEKWLRDHNQQVVSTPMPSDAVKTLENCFVIDDPKCARAIIDARSSAESLIAIRVEVASKKEKEVRLTIDWFVKGHSPVTARRNCEDCTESVLRTTIDAMLGDLAKQSPGFMGRIKAISEPPGMTVLLDNQTIGVTPIERDVPVGSHKARLVKDGRMGDEKLVNVESGAMAEIKLMPPPPGPPVDNGNVPPPPPVDRPSRTVPWLLTWTGVLAIAAGVTLYAVDPIKAGQDQYRTKLAGGITAGAGAAVAITGVILLLTTRGSSGPTVAITPQGDATIGWTGRF